MRVGAGLFRAWLIWAHFSGMLLIAALLGFGLVQIVTGNDAVIAAENVRLHTPVVPYKGIFEYTYDLTRLEGCPGEVITVFFSDKVPPAVVTTQRPSLLNDVRAYPGLKIDRPLPESVTPGKWRVQVSMSSNCANRKQTDLIAEFDIEVTP